ncbi:hypothetical protein K502DRAFT_327621 [Neoconidiobolus thromboides FSU 785]|nr:hypothetical protein K502DRAFT_327621 [Neoconidiobolus thromboides FSU 785]
MGKRNDSKGDTKINSNKKHRTMVYMKSKDRTGLKTVFEVNPGLPGIILFCDRNREKSCISEALTLFNEFAKEVYPELDISDTPEEEEKDIEAEITKEIEGLSSKKKNKFYFGSLKTQVDCMAFLFTKQPVEPVPFIQKLFEKVAETGITKTKHISRILPIMNTCYANIPDIESLAKKLFLPFFHTPDETTGKIDPKKFGIVFKKRNCGEIEKDKVIQSLAAIVGPEHKVDLDNPDLTIVVEIFKSICGISVLTDFNKYKKYNIQLVADQARLKEEEK